MALVIYPSPALKAPATVSSLFEAKSWTSCFLAKASLTKRLCFFWDAFYFFFSSLRASLTTFLAAFAKAFSSWDSFSTGSSCFETLAGFLNETKNLREFPSYLRATL
jgi:hypothetical protein